MFFRKKIFSKEDIIKEFWKEYQKLSPPERRRENLWEMILDSGYGIIGTKLIKTATPEGTEITLRDIFFYPLSEYASMFALCHNHPNNCSEPSKEDEELTQRIYEMSEKLGLTFLGHFIICENGTYSQILDKRKKEKSIPMITLRPHMTNLRLVEKILREWKMKK